VVTFGASVGVIATRGIGSVHAPSFRIARVVGADVAVVAYCIESRLASVHRMAGFKTVARIPVVTHKCFARFAARVGVARLRAVAHVAVVANQRSPPIAFSVVALVVDGTNISVITGEGVGGKDAARQRIAGVVGARVVVGTTQWYAARTYTLTAFVPDGAGVPVFACKPLVVRHFRALAGGRVAGGVQTDGVRPLCRSRADNLGSGGDRTFERPILQVADESAVTQIVVFQLRTISVGLAIARDLLSAALTIRTLVSHSAGIIVIAGGAVVLEHASAGTVAAVIRARVAVIAGDGVANANSCLAVVGDGARVSIQAFPFVKLDILAPAFALTVVIGAVVVVVTQVYVVPFVLHRFVHVAVAVVVVAVALLFCRCGRVAWGQTFFSTHPHALAGAVLVLDLARCPEGQGDGVVGAGTDSGFCNTLASLDCVNGHDIEAEESPGAVFSSLTHSAAETPFITVVHAYVLGTARSLAPFSGLARLAQVRVQGDAHVDQIRVAGPYLLARPAGRALLAARLCAHRLAHVLNAPARLALGVLGALVHETPFARIALQQRDFTSGFRRWYVDCRFLHSLFRRSCVRQDGLRFVADVRG